MHLIFHELKKNPFLDSRIEIYRFVFIIVVLLLVVFLLRLEILLIGTTEDHKKIDDKVIFNEDGVNEDCLVFFLEFFDFLFLLIIGYFYMFIKDHSLLHFLGVELFLLLQSYFLVFLK